MFSNPSLSNVFKLGGNKQAHRRSNGLMNAMEKQKSPKMGVREGTVEVSLGVCPKTRVGY